MMRMFCIFKSLSMISLQWMCCKPRATAESTNCNSATALKDHQAPLPKRGVGRCLRSNKRGEWQHTGSVPAPSFQLRKQNCRYTHCASSTHISLQIFFQCSCAYRLPRRKTRHSLEALAKHQIVRENLEGKHSDGKAFLSPHHKF